MERVPNNQPKPKALHPKVVRRIQDLKDDLVLQVAFGKGPFWELVREIRDFWGMEVPTQLPPEDFDWGNPRPLPPDGILFAKDIPFASEYIDWCEDIRRLFDFLAEIGQERYQERVDWHPFLAALVRYQPPKDLLKEFAEYGGISLREPLRPEERRFAHGDQMVVETLITTRPADEVGIWQDYYEALLKEIGKRLLEPQGLDIDLVRYDIEEETQLREKLEKDLKEAPQHTYVKLNNATREEQRQALQRAAWRVKEWPDDGRPKRRKLIEVEIAYRYVHLDERFPQLNDRYPEVITTQDTLENYVNAGREYLGEVG